MKKAMKRKEKLRKDLAKSPGPSKNKTFAKYGKLNRAAAKANTRLWRTKLGKKWQGARTGRKGG